MNLSGITGLFSKYVVQVLGGALAASLLLNVGLGIGLKHYIGQAASIKTAVVASNKATTEKKEVVEKRQEKNVVQTQDRTTSRIASAADSLRRNRPKPNLPQTISGSSGAATEGRTTIVLPEGSLFVDSVTYYHDQEICVKNTILAEEWPTFYQKQLDIWEEEHVGTNP